MGEEQHKRIQRKLRHGEQTPNSVDRLSDLPDSVLCHILSFLPTKISVATSILATRWRFLWSYVPNLHFHHDNEDCINSVFLLHRLQTINTFRLTDFRDENDQVEKCITFAIERNVKNIDIFLCMANLPRCIYTCKTLVDLTINSCDLLPESGSVFLPLLKKLHLFYVHQNGYDTLLSGCPVLEELLIYSYTDYASFKISSPTIKRLLIDLHSAGDESSNEPNFDYKRCYYKLEINTPALVYLNLADDSSQHIKCGPLDSLIEANIHIEGYIDDVVYARYLVEFIDRLRNAKFLKLNLSHYTKSIQSAFCARTISFRNLVKLEFSSDCLFSLKFLEYADNLEILILEEVHKQRAMTGCMEPEQVPTCRLSRLRTTKLVGIKGNLYELEIIRYLLRNAKVMEKMEIVYSRCLVPNQKINMLEEISTFQRGSSVCEVRYLQG
ncbi:hypothetical protein ACP275_13G073700 [Erythranthe tilingii]